MEAEVVVGTGCDCWCGNPDCRRAKVQTGFRVSRFELVAIASLAVLFLALLRGNIVEASQLYSAWPMPFLGIVAATIAMSTPAGGGVVFFPTMVMMGVPPVEAVAFSLGAQSVGMGIFGTFNWMQRDRSAILFPVVIPVVVIGSASTLLALLVFPVAEARPLQLVFSLFGVGLASRVFYTLRSGAGGKDGVADRVPWTLVASATVGLIGGLFVGYIGAGIDALLFLVLTSRFKVDVHQATVTSIVAMGLTAMVPFGVHLFIMSDVPIHLWLMVLPGILVGARIGPWLNRALGSRKILFGFASLLLVEFLMTFTKLVVLR